jgi:hypothetical protein
MTVTWPLHVLLSDQQPVLPAGCVCNAQLFQRSHLRGGAADKDRQGSWTYMGAATVSLQRAFGPRKEALAALRVTLNGVVAADVLVSRWEQLVRPLRDGYATVTRR